jgi:hypothetical protein
MEIERSMRDNMKRMDESITHIQNYLPKIVTEKIEPLESKIMMLHGEIDELQEGGGELESPVTSENEGEKEKVHKPSNKILLLQTMIDQSVEKLREEIEIKFEDMPTGNYVPIKQQPFIDFGGFMDKLESNALFSDVNHPKR